MGFASNWVDIIMRCISSVSYFVVLNGKLRERFVPSRGLRQGDPLSHCLFLICSGGLSTLMRLALGEGQCINYDKSIVCFSSNVLEDNQNSVSILLGVQLSNEIERYLGLPNWWVGKESSIPSFKRLS
ncbi:reverse transcriptase [Gossypium australe]|uniref:Reverse transcriptase n=1 Tax=Gossypium australe TaxID=47621 RepID=A0A5B6X1N8_9ROSI|nr:reverse transcriptase [Gossypium australe]